MSTLQQHNKLVQDELEKVIKRREKMRSWYSGPINRRAIKSIFLAPFEDPNSSNGKEDF